MSAGFRPKLAAALYGPTERSLTAQVIAACPFSIAQEYTVDYLRRAQAGFEEAEVRVPIRFLPTFARRRVGVTFGVHLDSVEGGRPHEEIRVRWNAGTPLLPDFHGTVRFRIDGSDTRVIVDGRYVVPFGLLGRVFDRLAGSMIARIMLRDFSNRIALYLEHREREWRLSASLTK